MVWAGYCREQQIKINKVSLKNTLTATASSVPPNLLFGCLFKSYEIKTNIKQSVSSLIPGRPSPTVKQYLLVNIGQLCILAWKSITCVFISEKVNYKWGSTAGLAQLAGTKCYSSNFCRNFSPTSAPGHLLQSIFFCKHIFLRSAIAGTKYF